MGYRLNRLDEPVFMAVSKSLLTEFGIDHRLESCGIRGELKKSGLASEAITRVLRQLEQNGQVLRNPYNICKILVYSSFGYVEN